MSNNRDSKETDENRDMILKKIREAKDASLILKDDIAYTGVGQTLEGDK